MEKEPPRSRVTENITKCRIGKKTITFAQGRYAWNGVTLNEVSVNNTVARISLPTVDLKELQSDYSSSRKRKINQRGSNKGNNNKKVKTEHFVSRQRSESPVRQQRGTTRGGDKSRLSMIEKAVNRLMTKNLEQPKIQVKKPSALFKSDSPQLKQKDKVSTTTTPKPSNSKKNNLNAITSTNTPNSEKKFNNIYKNSLTSSSSRADKAPQKHDSSSRFPLERKTFFATKSRPTTFFTSNTSTSTRRLRNFSEFSQEKHYCIKFLPCFKYNDRKLNYKFSQLAIDVRTLKLPTSNWKIRIFVTNKQISSIKFSNKQEVERCVTFNSDSNVYGITIDNKKAMLLGSPITLDNRSDIEILLDIVHFIRQDNPMIRYIT